MMEVKISRCFRNQNVYEAVWFKLLQKESLLYGNKLLAQVLLFSVSNACEYNSNVLAREYFK